MQSCIVTDRHSIHGVLDRPDRPSQWSFCVTDCTAMLCRRLPVHLLEEILEQAVPRTPCQFEWKLLAWAPKGMTVQGSSSSSSETSGEGSSGSSSSGDESSSGDDDSDSGDEDYAQDVLAAAAALL
jgi:uncharacterized membrane protein YgcG